jgi:hypothetical protein
MLGARLMNAKTPPATLPAGRFEVLGRATRADSDTTLLKSWVDNLGPVSAKKFGATATRFLAELDRRELALRSATVEDVRDALNGVLHPEKTKIVYCRDANRRGDFPNTRFDFLGFQFRARKTTWGGKSAHGFLPAASPKALTRISRTIRR